MTSPVTVRAPAKINPYLHVGDLDANGYHELTTVYMAIGLYDDVTVSDAAAWTIDVAATGELDVSGVPLDATNIVIRAGKLLTAHHDITRKAHISIAKGIPVAGGMAGGSADAAATLVALDRLWDLQTSDDDLLELAARLGSDVPFALLGGTAAGSGHGEIVTPVTDNGQWWWLAIPVASGGLSTPEVYAEFDRLAALQTTQGPMALLDALRQGDVDQLAGALHNELQAPAVSLRPDLLATLDVGLEAGAVAVLVSGSGPTVLCLCRDQEHALATKQALLESGIPSVVGAPGPVAGVHMVEYA